MSIFHRAIKEFTEQNNIKDGKPIFACWAYRRNYHTYEEKSINGKKVSVCKCGEIYIPTPPVKKGFKKVLAREGN